MKLWAFLLTVVVLTTRTAVALSPDEWNACLYYKFPTVEDYSWQIDINKAGEVFIYDWKLTNPVPTEAELTPTLPEAMTAMSNRVAEAKSNVDKWSDLEPASSALLRDATRAMLICVNKRLTNKITMSEFKSELKNQMNK